MRIAMLSPIAWRTPPRHYGPWERVTSLLVEALVQQGVDVTLFATKDSETAATLQAVVPAPYEEDRTIDAKVWSAIHIAEVFEHAAEYDIIHNHFDFLPLSYSGLVRTPVLTTIHGISSEAILPVYRRYNRRTQYVAISDADRVEGLDYIATIHHGIDIDRFRFRADPEDYLLYFGRIHPDKGTAEAIEIARQVGRPLKIAGIIQDSEYFRQMVEPHINGVDVIYLGSVGPEQRDGLLGGGMALLHPISFDEPFGLSVIEAMACGTPVVAYNRGSMPELIESGRTGFLVDDVDSAVQAINSLDRIDRSCCRTTVEERFTDSIMAKKYIDVYTTILGGHEP